MSSKARSVAREAKRKSTDVYEFTSWELLQLYMVVGAQTGTASDMRRWWRILDLLEPDESEKELLGWKDVPEGVYLESQDFGHVMELEVTKIDFDWIVKIVSEYNGWRAGGAGGAHRKLLMVLFDKLGID